MDQFRQRYLSPPLSMSMAEVNQWIQRKRITLPPFRIMASALKKVIHGSPKTTAFCNMHEARLLELSARGVLRELDCFLSRTALRDHQPPTTNCHQPPTATNRHTVSHSHCGWVLRSGESRGCGAMSQHKCANRPRPRIPHHPPPRVH